MNRKIKTVYEYPPIPDRSRDWYAYYDDGKEENCHYGWGKTELEAVSDLMISYPEEDNCDICGDCHDVDNIPLSCQTGDGE